MFEVRDNKLLLAIGGHEEDIGEDRLFYGSEEDWMQWATFWYNKDKKIEPHIHKKRNRQGKYKTHEFIYVIRGCLRVDFYNLNKKLIESKKLHKGGFVMLYDGGHGFVIEKPDTKFIEVKHGPFVSVEKDKEKF